MIKILICGYGSIGKKHTANLKKLGADIKIWRQRTDQKQEIEENGFVFEPSLESGLLWCDAVIIATATDQHVSLALQAAQAKKAIYLEKPISHNRDNLDKLSEEAAGLVIEVGCQLRQHPVLKALHALLHEEKDGKILSFRAWVGQRLDEWRPGTDYRQCYSANAKRGGGALFDLVHEVDLITWLIGPVNEVYADLRQNSNLEMEAEDLANLLLTSENGAAGTVQLDMLSPAYRRGIEVICERAVYGCHLKEGSLWRYEGNNEPTLVNKVPQNYQPANMLYDAMAHFLDRVKDPSIPAACSLQEGLHDLDILLAARKANQTKTQQIIDDNHA